MQLYVGDETANRTEIGINEPVIEYQPKLLAFIYTWKMYEILSNFLSDKWKILEETGMRTSLGEEQLWI